MTSIGMWMKKARCNPVEYNDTVIRHDKVRLTKYYYEHYSFVKDIQMIFATVLGFKVLFAGEEI